MITNSIIAAVMVAGILCVIGTKLDAIETAAETRAAEPAPAERLCQEYWKLLTEVPLVPGAELSQRENYSSNREYAKSSAALIQGTIGGRIEPENFCHLPFVVTLLDRKIEGNFFVFDFGGGDRLKKYLPGWSKELLGKQGILTAKAPQQFEAGVKDNCLLVLVMDGVRLDEAASRLFERFEQMTAANPAPAERLCQEYWKLLTEVPLVPGAELSQRENYSSNREYAKSAAALIQGTIGGRIEPENFRHLPFVVTLLDRKIEGTFFVFDFGGADRLKKYLLGWSKEALGKQGVLTAKAPQQFEAGVKDYCLLVLIIDGVRLDEPASKLFERFEQMTSKEAPDPKVKKLKPPNGDEK